MISKQDICEDSLQDFTRGCAWKRKYIAEGSSWGHHIVFGQVQLYNPSVEGDQQNVLSFIGSSLLNGFSSRNMTATTKL